MSVVRGGLIASPHGAISSQSIVLGHPAPAYARAYAAPAYAAPALAAPAYASYGLGLGKIYNFNNSIVITYSVVFIINYKPNWQYCF